MIGIWFTFGPDTECVIESIRSFREVFPGAVICISDDARNPLSAETLNLIRPDQYEFRKWNSKGNLNGWAAVKGILTLQQRMHELYPGHSGAIKVDSDTMILSDLWLDHAAPICGFSAGNQCLFSGMARYLRHDVPGEILRMLESRWLWDEAAVPEDITIASYCLYRYGLECASRNWTDGALSFSYVDERKNDKPCCVITFGNRHEIKGVKSCDKRSIVGMAMARYRAANPRRHVGQVMAEPPPCDRR
jgi:hypothetical protein